MSDCVAQFYQKLEDDPSLKHYKIEASADARGVITLTGEVDVWKHVVDIGHAAGKSGVKGVIN